MPLISLNCILNSSVTTKRHCLTLINLMIAFKNHSTVTDQSKLICLYENLRTIGTNELFKRLCHKMVMKSNKTINNDDDHYKSR